MEIKVLITRKSCDYYDQVGILESCDRFGSATLYRVVVDNEEFIYLQKEDYCLVETMVTRVHDGIPVLLTPQEAEEFDSKIKRNKIFLQPSDG